MIHRGKAVILTYHSISDGPPPLCIPQGLFVKQMEWLKLNANVVSFAALVELLVQGGAFPARTVALTFDDGFDDFAAAAAPILKRLNLPAIVFLPTGYCGSRASWNSRTAGRALLTWDQIKELSGQGFEFGSHSVNHPALHRLSGAELSHEIAESKQVIDTKIGRDTRFFCYPYGCFNPRVLRAVSARYSGGACSTELRPVFQGDDSYALPRIDVHYLRIFQIFRLFLEERLGLYLGARRVIRKLSQTAFPMEES
jgi:peptidoglycan/xylan/chitin deacetylase (PgdA/CDA1 family)